MSITKTKQFSRDIVCEGLTKNYLRKKAIVNVDIDVEIYDLALDLLYNLKQAEIENILSISKSDLLDIMDEAEELYLKFKLDDAEKKFLLLAEEGYARAMYFLGMIYSVKGKNEEADNWWKKGADLNDLLCRLNTAYHQDITTENSENIISNIMDELKDSVNNGDIYAQDELASIYYDKQNDDALRLYMLSAKKGNWNSMNGVANIHYNKGNYSEAIKWYELSAKLGYDTSLLSLGNLYRDGLGVTQDNKMAIELYEKAYELNLSGSGIGANSIGVIYHNDKNYPEANKWFILAGKAGNDWGWNNIANDYLWGCGYEKDVDKALYYYQKAYEMNGEALGNAAFQIGSILNNKGKYDEAKNALNRL